jgi:ribonuclease HI
MCIHLTCSPMSIEQMNRWTDGRMKMKWNENEMNKIYTSQIWMITVIN